MKVKTDYEGCPYITPGKEYETELIDQNSAAATLDDGIEHILFLPRCSWIDGQAWEIVTDD